MATEMIKGKPIEEALGLSNKAVAEALDGLPPVKMHCSVLAEEAVRAAVKDYYDRHGIAYNPTSSAPVTARAVTHTIPETGCKEVAPGYCPRRPGIRPPAALAIPAAVVPGGGMLPALAARRALAVPLRGLAFLVACQPRL